MALAGRVDEVETKSTRLEFRLGLLENTGLNYASASFDPAADKSFSRIDSTTGTFLVAVENATPYVDGFKVTCDFGNPSSATYHGFKLKVKWGPRFDSKTNGTKSKEWFDTLQEKELTMTETLRGGSWNPVTFVVSPAKADQFGYLEISIETRQISLGR